MLQLVKMLTRTRGSKWSLRRGVRARRLCRRRPRRRLLRHGSGRGKRARSSRRRQLRRPSRKRGCRLSILPILFEEIVVSEVHSVVSRDSNKILGDRTPRLGNCEMCEPLKIKPVAGITRASVTIRTQAEASSLNGRH